MTIKIKIILGFIVLMAVIIYTSAIGYRGFTSSLSDLQEYSKYADADVGLSDYLRYLGRAVSSTVLYINTQNEDEAKRVSGFMDKADKSILSSLESMKASRATDSSSGILKELEELRQQSTEFGQGLVVLCNFSRESVAIYSEKARPITGEIMISLNEINKGLSSYDAANQTEKLSALWHRFGLLTTKVARYATSRKTVDHDDVMGSLSKLDECVAGLKTVTPSEKSKVFSKMEQDIKTLKNYVQELGVAATGFEKNFTSLDASRQSLYDKADELNSEIGDFKDKLHGLASTRSSSGQNQLFISSIGGSVIGGVIAISIIYSLIKILNDISGFVRAIAQGNFTHKVQSKEKGEIGEMISGMQQIPAVLQKLINDVIGGVKRIQVGYFTNRLNADEYSGSYSELVKTVNTVADTYTEILDEIPVPLLTADKNNQVHYSNIAGKSMLDGKLIEAYVTEGESNFGINAIESGETYSTESNFIKDDSSKTMNATAVPLKDYDGNPVAFIEIVTDLTAIREQQKVMLQVAEEATEIATRVAAASEEIAAQVEQVSRGADVQRSRVESTASAMTEMNATVIEVARNASEAAEQSDTTRSKAESGSELVNNVMKSINQVNTVSQNLHTNMQELGAQAESIGNVMNVISDIADQTNLLALNAAIEAARAGEAGRGFAVVADEVRKLAEKTMQATQEVGSSISAVQQSARVNIDEVGKAVTAVEEANQLANSSGEALAEIVNLASANSNVVNSIATAAEEQSATSSEISNALSEINTIVGETTEGMVQSSAAIQDLSSMAQDLQRVMSGLR